VTRRSRVICVALALLCLGGAPSPSLAQGSGRERPPSDLWKKFPINPRPAAKEGGARLARQAEGKTDRADRGQPRKSAGVNQPPRRSARRAAGKGSGRGTAIPVAVVLPLVLLFIAAAVAVPVAIRRRRRLGKGTGMLPPTAAGGLSSVKSIVHAAAPSRLGRPRSHPPPEHRPNPSPPRHRPDQVRPSGASASPAPGASAPPTRGGRGSAPAASDPPRREPSPTTVTRPAAPSPPPAPRPAAEGDGTGTLALAYVSAPVRGARAELHRQRRAIDAACRGRGWRLQQVARDLERQAGDESRPGLEYALDRLARGEASCLIVAELGRLSRSAAELGRIIDWLGEHEIRLLALDVELDTATPVGKLAAEALSSAGARERERLAALAGHGPARDPFRAGAVGRPAVGDIPALKEYITALRASGLTLQAIADRLNAESVPTLRGGQKWRPSSVQAAVGYRRPPARPGQSQVDGGRRDASGGAS
jgi:hypothetical protein